MELSIANKGANGFFVSKMRNDKDNVNDTEKIMNSVIKESMVAHVNPLKYFSKKKETKVEIKHDGNEKQCPALI